MASPAAAQAFAAAARMALKAFPLQPRELTLISQSENVAFKVIDKVDGAAYALRLHRPGYHTLAALQSEHIWTRALAAAGIAVPTPLATRDGGEYVEVSIEGVNERRYAGVASWIQGENLDEVLRRRPEARIVSTCYEQIGALLAAIHNHSSGWQSPANFKRHALDADGLMGEAPFWGRFWEYPVLSAAERVLLRATRDRVNSALVRYGKDPKFYSMIHADPIPQNVLIEDGRVALIDFDDAAFGWHQYDLAVALTTFWGESSFPGYREACIRGYRSVRKISDQALTLLPLFLLARGLAEIGWMYQRPEIAPPRTFITTKEWLCVQCEAFEPPC